MFVIVDLDRVLIQNPFLFGVFPEVCRTLRPFVPKSVPDDEANRWLVARIYDRHRELLMAQEWVASSDWDAIVGEVAKDLVCETKIDVTGLVHRYARPPYIAAYLDAVPALEWVRARASKIFWISNGFARYQVPVMEALGLQKYFDGYFAPDTHGAIKPYAAIYDQAIEAAGEPADQGVMVGDSLTTDVAGGRRNGLYTIWLDRTLNPVFQAMDPWEAPKMELFPQYVETMIRRESAPSAYGLDVPKECIPDAVIWSLSQLPEVLSRYAQGAERRVG